MPPILYVSGAAHLQRGLDGAPVTMIRVEGLADSVAYRCGELQKLLKQKFTKVANVKPPASRADSSEKFVVATGFRGA